MMAREAKYGNLTIPGIPDDEPVFIFRAQDQLAPVALEAYKAAREGVGDIAGADGVSQAIHDFSQWPMKKMPD